MTSWIPSLLQSLSHYILVSLTSSRHHQTPVLRPQLSNKHPRHHPISPVLTLNLSQHHTQRIPPSPLDGARPHLRGPRLVHPRLNPRHHYLPYWQCPHHPSRVYLSTC
ncbi:uncharacterized protein EDB91DRAFT_1184923 [Suillus paluster]|uniref:uncharacterized protein n=1 Tax=Suillus paluster TaxID=48578 RepID=UPI001B88175E|nr:uncharacterized protein EDB91DRAFT_1184923 [Suillus paluster]KAG1718567.1 hypothetical protein EDB91DRAFT_1184923 [Suillus paluster]